MQMICILYYNDSYSYVNEYANDLHVIKNADYIVYMGPERGEAGFEIIFTGTPKDLKNCKTSKTAKFL